MFKSTLNEQILAKTPYANLYTAKLEDVVAHSGMRDLFRVMLDKSASGFTSEYKSIATRIDRIYSEVMGGVEHLSI